MRRTYSATVERAIEDKGSAEAAIYELQEIIKDQDARLAEVEGVTTEEPWYMTICLECGATSHSPRPDVTCPNDGLQVVRFPGLTTSWGLAEVCRAIHRAQVAQKEDEAARQGVDDAVTAALS